MSITTAQFEKIAERVAEETATLLHAPVCVTNDQGMMVAGSEPGLAKLSRNWIDRIEGTHYLRIPLCLDAAVGEVLIGEPSNGEVVSDRLAQVVVDLVIKQTVVDRLSDWHERKNKFIHDLLHGLITDEPTMRLHANSLDLDFSPPRAVILIDAADYILASDKFHRGAEGPEGEIQRHVHLVIDSIVNFFYLPDETICAYMGNGEVAVLKASDTQNLAPWVNNKKHLERPQTSWADLTALKRAADALLVRLRDDTRSAINIGIGRYHPGIRRLSQSYKDAEAALFLGARLNGSNRVYSLDRLGMAAFVGLSDEQTKLELATYLLSPLDDEDELLETLHIFFAEDCYLSATANQLSIHRNTLSYRLDKIASLTGLDPRRFDDAVQIRLALMLRSLHARPAPH